jgi:heme/copper-type cytochrome/quinol oxidase subunit 1
MGVPKGGSPLYNSRPYSPPAPNGLPKALDDVGIDQKLDEQLPLVFVGFHFTFFPQFIAGYLGMPRRYHAYPPEFQVFNVLSTAGASILAVGYLVPAIYLIWSMRYGRRAVANPWNLPGLEWRIQSPPLTENFTSTPIVTWAAYEFAPPEKTEVVGKFLDEQPQKA